MKKEITRDICKVFAVGGTALFMAGTAGFLAYLSTVLFWHIPALSGYCAVGAFFTALVALASAIGITYMCGAWVVRKGKFSK